MRKRRRQNPRFTPSTGLIKRLAGLVIGLFLLIGLIAIYQSAYLTLQTIECRLHHQEACPSEIVVWLSDTTPRFIFALNTTDLKKKLRLNFPYVESADMMVTFPHHLIVDIKYYRPVIAIEWPDRLLYYSASAIPFPDTVTSSTVPIIKVTGIMETDSKTIQAIIDLNQAITFGSVSVKSFEVIDQFTLEASLTGGYIALFNPQGDVSRQVATLQAIFKAATMNPQLPYIDVRFDKPVFKPLVPIMVNEPETATAGAVVVED
jgi:cell division septal protein FtsQ